MRYFVLFLEGFLTFISPCLLPMLPVYVLYFAGGKSDNKKNTLINALGFVFGFTIVFVLMGAFAGTIGLFLKSHLDILNKVLGFIIILFGLGFIGVFKINFRGFGNTDIKISGFLSSLVFGAFFSVGFTPCVGTFLGSALMMASSKGTAAEGIIMLLFYSAGLGIPFVVSAVLIDRLKSAFDFIKKNYRVINILSGILLIIIGILVMTGISDMFLTI